MLHRRVSGHEFYGSGASTPVHAVGVLAAEVPMRIRATSRDVFAVKMHCWEQHPISGWQVAVFKTADRVKVLPS